MSNYGRHRSISVNSRNSRQSNTDRRERSRVPSASGSYGALTGPTITPSPDRMFEACAATAAFFLYAQRNVVLSLHHDTLDIDRRFERHRDDVRWIEVDNISERGAGRLVVSYDVSQTAIVWDVMNGEELARFASYEEIRVAAWMKNGEIAFGNDQGNIILFDPETKEHLSRKTIYDPITALAPSADCRLFAIGYANGSILIAGLHPGFNMIHSLSTQRHPSPINALSWHGSSSKSKSEMLASQTMDGDLRVWSIPKSPNGDAPSVIRNFQQGGMERTVGPCWFGWSKMGRIVQYIDNQTLAWDVRTKKVTYESVPTIEGVVGIANYGPQAVLFTIGRNHTVQQYDLNPTGTPMLVRNVQHVPATGLPPSPPISDIDQARHRMPTIASAVGLTEQRRSNNLPLYMDAASTDGEESYGLMSPIQRIANDAPSENSEMSEQSEEEHEHRDRVGPLSPTSSRSSAVSRTSSRRQKMTYPSRRERQLTSRLRPQSPGMQSTRSGSTIMTSSSVTSEQRRPPRSSRLNQEVLRSPDNERKDIDLFPFIRAHVRDVPFRPPVYPEGARTADLLRTEMLKCVFGWDGDISELIRDELSRHEPGSPAAVLLAKWLGDLGADMAASMVGSQSMTSSDWMLLALSAVGGGAQKKVGDAFVQRLLEKGDVHPAVAILLGLGEIHEAIEIYVSRKLHLEAVMLCCLVTPHDWTRQCHLIRKWGETAMSNREADLAVRCFACTSVESSEQWTSPASKDMVYEAQMQYMGPTATSPGASSQTSSVGPLKRLAPRSAGLKLITDFSSAKTGKLPNSAMDSQTPIVMTGITPIDTAFGPRTGRRQTREPMSSMTATPGGLTSMRMPSRGRWVDEISTPVVRRDRSAMPESAIRIKDPNSFLAPGKYIDRDDHLPSPAVGVFSKDHKHSRSMSRDRKPGAIRVESDIVMLDPALPSGNTESSIRTGHSTIPGSMARGSEVPLSAQIRSLDEYVHNMTTNDERRAEDSRHPESRNHQSRAMSRGAAPSEGRSRRYTRGSQRSPTSPVSMSPEDSGLRGQMRALNRDDANEKYYQEMISPTESSYSRQTMDTNRSKGRGRSKAGSISHGTSGRSSSKVNRRGESIDPITRTASRNHRRDQSRPVTPEKETGRRGRSVMSSRRSPHSPVSMTIGDDEPRTARKPRDQSVGARVRARATSQNRQAGQSPDRHRARNRATSMSRRGSPDENQKRVRSQSAKPAERRDRSPSGRASRQSSRPPMPRLQTDFSQGPGKRQTAQAELEAARLNLLGRPSVPAITHPDDLIPRSATSLGFTNQWDDLPRSHTANPETSGKRSNRRMTSNERIGQEQELLRSQTVDPDAQRRYLGHPMTPKAMRAPKYDSDAPSVPQLPAGIQQVHDNDQLLTLPSSTFTLSSATFKAPSRAASAPPEKFHGGHNRQSSRQERQQPHSRMGSVSEQAMPPPPPPAPADAVIHHPSVYLSDDIMIVRDSMISQGSDDAPIDVLPQLRHLQDPQHAMPPPPPMDMPFRPISDASTASGDMINIAIDDIGGPSAPTPLAQYIHSSTPMPQMGHARHASNDIVVQPTLDNSAYQLPQSSYNTGYQAAPYESVPQPSLNRNNSAPLPHHAHSRSFDATTGVEQVALQLLPSTAYQAPGQGQNHSNPSFSSGPRDPKQIRAAMTTEQIQFGMGAPTGLLPATTYLPERPATTAPQSNVRMPRGLENYRDSAQVRANMPPSSTQAGFGVMEGRPF